MIRPATRTDEEDVADLAVGSGLFATDDAGLVTTMMAEKSGRAKAHSGRHL